MATTPSGPAPPVGGAARWTSRLLSAAEGKFRLLLVVLVGLMGAAPLIPSPVSEAVLTLFTEAVLVASLHAARPGGRPAEVAPATEFARNAASLDAMTGQVYLAVGVARLAGLHVTPPRRETAGLSKT
jgi:hypothetical protein